MLVHPTCCVQNHTNLFFSLLDKESKWDEICGDPFLLSPAGNCPAKSGPGN